MEKNEEVKNKFVETYADDMAKVIEDNKGGELVKKIIHGEEEHEKEKRNVSPESIKNRFFMVMGIILILVGLAVLYLFLSKEPSPAITVAEQPEYLIFHDSKTSIEVVGLKREQIISAILGKVESTKVKKGGIEGIYLTNNKKDVGLREFLQLTKANLVSGSNTFLIKEDFLMGVVNDGTKDFFMVIKMRSVTDIFRYLRNWESKMFVDLQGFFGIATTPENEYLLKKKWEDGILENKNARILYDNENKIVMMYVFANDNSIVITNTEDAFHEIMLRLATSQIKK